MIPQEYIQEVVRRNDIEEVIGQYVQLRRRGRTLSGLCPFHNEKTPSFVVYPDTQSFYCFGCGAAGDVINFVRKYNNLGYVESIKQLAARAGMPLPEEEDREAKARQRLLEINRSAARYFYEQLNARTPEAAQARRYWKEKRGLSDAAIRRFGLGYAPDDFGGLLHYLRRRGFTEAELEHSGLVKRSAKGNLYDIFRHRVMVPIIDVRGSIIAFGGRVLDDSKPKYINSPETMVYHKSRTLFALNIAKKSTAKRYILCEGYMDVISMHEAGFDTAVCACGTALTAEQVKLLSEYADEVVLSYDSDEAGQKATERSLALFANSPVKVSVLSYQGAKDPDEFIKKYGRERFEMLLNGTANPTEFQLKKAKAKYDLRSDDGRLSYIREAIDILTGHAVSPTARDVYAGRLAEETGVSKQAVLSQLDGALRAADRRSRRKEQKDLAQQGIAADIRIPYTQGGDAALGAASASRQLVAALLQDPDQIPYVRDRLQMDGVVLPEMQQALQGIFRCADERLPVNLTSLQQLLDEKAFRQAALAQAQNHGQRLARQDIDMYLDRLNNAKPVSQRVAGTSDDQFLNFFANVKKEKGVQDPPPDNGG
ncbi:MAG TPA: DNA primase [Candidatus Gemmiger excrementavium]|uniref:DNA primase n=1 Tax=Candidatus Gemmiger excrementavium TaxID=2838608 RepID=A0A9D2JG61_9FIRM|nr:DNA primase [Candidatus Gemmiger excrementavium]